ncbi:MAG: phosphoribosylglycinamide formyltransferase [Candidatus Hydrogenedentes bacterium]|nr:phosphoribosylglycinamide formyltransferase [Candidatus Hydrogenedentota bacterium]
MPLKLAVLLSGSGSTFQNFLECIEHGTLDAEVVCVVASRTDAFGLERARKAGVPALVVARKSFSDTVTFSDAVWNEIGPFEPDLVALAGFMCLLHVPEAYTNRMMNVHPALIPAFCGKGMYGHRVHEAVLKSGVDTTGATVHFVDNEYDHGPIILQEEVPVHEGDTAESLAARVQAVERELYPRVVQLFAEDKLVVTGQQVQIRE